MDKETQIVETWLVGEDASQRLDKFVGLQLPELSRVAVQNLIKKECLLVNGKPAKASYKVQANDKIALLVDNTEAAEETFELAKADIPIEIVYEDDEVIVVNKARGMVVHPAKSHQQDTLVNALLFHSDNLSEGSAFFRPGIVHRIDKDTSGLLVVAKNNHAHNNLSKQLQDHTMQRQYVAFVSGLIEHQTGTINAPIGRDPKNRLKFTVTENGKEAVTHFEVLERFEMATLVSCRLETGRTHQIRVHMNYIGHPIVDDPIYNDAKSVLGVGQLLHAKTLGFEHPKTHEFLIFDSDLPKEFETYKNLLK